MIGLVADSHVPDRRRDLHPDMLERFKKEKVTLILHAGDISFPGVLSKLERIAPVEAVRGNYDFFFMPALPMAKVINIQGMHIGLTHGHGGLAKYIDDKIKYWLGTYKGVDFFAERAENLLPDDVDAVCFGHSHFPVNRRKGRKLIVNPGSSSAHLYGDQEWPSFALLKIANQQISAEIIKLDPDRF